jgi:uncharacterized protein YndB with AHSA1/START domain
MEFIKVIIAAEINSDIEKVWHCYTDPVHIVNWCQASDEWHAPSAENDLRPGGRFKTRMEAKDGSMGFDFSGKYTRVDTHQCIEYTLDDDRKVGIVFTEENGFVKIEQWFEAETSNPVEMQQAGWQAILHNFKNYVETL